MQRKAKSSLGLQGPTDADEYLALGVGHEEAGEKWRAGDAAKAARFFLRAVDVYEQGLARFPHSFDLIYNKARVQFQITQHSALLAHWPSSSPVVLLEDALVSHRKALALDADNSDALFNTAQVLTCLAEVIDQSHEAHDYPLSPTRLLEEALSMFKKCLELQQTLYDQLQEQISAAPLQSSIDSPANDSNDLEVSTKNEHVGERWATVIEAVTETSLLETTLAMLDCLGTLCAANGTDRTLGLDDLEYLFIYLSESRIPAYLSDADVDATYEADLAIAKVQASLLEAKFRACAIDFKIYDQGLASAFSRACRPVDSAQLRTLVAFAEALIDFSEAVSKLEGLSTIRWTRLNKALECLTQASKIDQAPDLELIHIARGDVEMLRFMLASKDDLPDNLKNVQVQNTLLKNAQTFYRGAAQIAATCNRNGRASNHAWALAKVKEAVAACLSIGGIVPLTELLSLGVDRAETRSIIETMFHESLLSLQLVESRGIPQQALSLYYMDSPT